MIYSAAKAAAICAQLMTQQQLRLEDYNRFALYSHEMPMAVVNRSPIAISALRAQTTYERFCLNDH